MRLLAAAVSDLGLRRDSNEDSALVRPDLGLFVVADGMGGHAAGEIASRIAVGSIEAYIEATAGAASIEAWPFGYDAALGIDGTRLTTAFRLANRAIGEHATGQPDTLGMATTAVGLLVGGIAEPAAGPHADEPQVLPAFVAHVGDSRIYLWREGELQRLTRDHSWVEEQISAGALTTSAAREHPWRNLVTRALGGGPDPDTDILPLSLESGDRLLLCSDGLSAVVTDEVIAEVVARRRGEDLDGLCHMLVDAANAAGGPDNITVIVVEVARGPDGR